ncbi:MAG: hypothetical protein KAX24_07075 [Anaerolineae bacterium]|nr:hypothetical protein [Anaerolineae bacterium]
MKARFRLLEKRFRDEGRWRVWGTVYENCVPESQDQTLLFRTIPDDDRRTARFFGARVRELSPNIEEAERLIDESYPIRFRVLPEIRTVEGANHREIRARLWEVIFEEMEKRRAERRVEYAVPEPAYVALREGSEEEN